MNLMPQFRSLYLTYCANHPSAVNVLTQHRWVMEEETQTEIPPLKVTSDTSV